ncbi:MAG: TonB-dependent receptor, partial [Acidobacteriota bacterium]|nr:TonB-dependent receptor [Acidobacteriota bacterium]
IRGASYEETLILLNGLRLNDAQTGHNNLDIPFPFASLERIEVMKGAGSTLYGSDALGGTVNFITAAPRHTEVRAGAAMGNFGTNQQDAALSLVRRKFTEQLSLTRELSTGFTADRNYRNLAVASETTRNTALGHTDILLGLSDRPYGAAGFYGVTASIPSFERDKAWMAAWKQALGKQTTADFAYRRHTDVYIYTLADPAAYENNHLAEYYQASARRYEKLNGDDTVRLYYGADAMREHINSSNLGVHARDQAGVYAAFDARALRHFSFNAGVREELYTGGRQVFSPSLSGAYWATSRVKLRASVSHAFRLPDYTELYYSDPVHTGNPTLKPETSWSYEGGTQVYLARELTVDAAVFHHRDTNVIDYARAIGATTPYVAGNIQQLNFTGTELALRWQLPHQQRIALAYAALHGAGSWPANTQYLYAFNYAEQSGSATWWSKACGFDSRFRLSAVQRYGGNPYPLVEWTVGREFRYATPYVQLTNLTDTKYQEISGVAMPGRGVMGGVELRWRAK